MNEEIRAWFAAREDPRSQIVARLCEIIEDADSRVIGEIKWGAPSYRITEHFATTGLPPRGGVRLVLHRGAKARGDAPRPTVDDAERMLEWRSADRAVLTFGTEAEVRSRRDALIVLLQQWIAQTQ